MRDPEPKFLQFEVRGLAIDRSANAPILLLQDVGGRVVLPIWIGPAEAGAIATALEGRQLPRPMTHDLIMTLIDELGAQMVGLDVRALDEGTFKGTLRLERAGQPLTIDCRPSDGVAMAVRAKAPIRVAAEVLHKASPLAPDTPPAREPPPSQFSADQQRAADMSAKLAAMDRDDFGDYEM